MKSDIAYAAVMGLGLSMALYGLLSVLFRAAA
jgi:hypothetical protein